MKNKQTYKPEQKPGYLEYKNMGHEFRPFILFSNEENYKTDRVNTDKFGFRKTFFKNKFIGLDEIKNHSSQQNLIIGGSTAFSMGSTSDKTTIHSLMNTGDDLWFSLGIRGATARQELITFLCFKNFFPKINNVVIFSGMNDLTVCSQAESMFYYNLGGILGGAAHERMHAGFLQASSFSKLKSVIGRANLFHSLSYLINKFKIFKIFSRNILSKLKKSKIQLKTDKLVSSLNYEKKIANTKIMLKSDFEIWSALSKQFNFKLTYIFQPGITWTKKKLTTQEENIKLYHENNIREVFEEDFSNPKIYVEHKNFLQETCEINSIKFYDANDFIVKADLEKDFFIDFGHFTTYGNNYIAESIKNIVKN